MNAAKIFHILSIMLILSLISVPAGPARAGDASSGPLDRNGWLYWNTFLGGSESEWGKGIAVDGNGNIYITGRSHGSWGNPVHPYTGGSGDAFVARLNRNGARVWNTFLGGTSWDEGRSIAVDAGGNVYIIGVSPMSWGSPVNDYAGGLSDTFVAKLDSTGALLWNTFLGCDNWDDGWGIAVEGSGPILVTGVSPAEWGSPKNGFAGGTGDAFVASLDADGSLLWNTFLGGNDWDTGQDIALDGNGNMVITGWSNAGWGSPVNAFTGKQAAMVARLDSTGALTWNTFLGGTLTSSGYGIAVDGNEDVYVTGGSSDWGSPVNPFAGYNDAFVARLDTAGGLVWNTFLGGSMFEEAHDLALDQDGNIYLTGESDTAWGVPLRAYSGNMDVFAARLDSSGVLAWNTFLGGSKWENGGGLATGGDGGVYITGRSESSWGMPLRPFAGLSDAFVAKLGMAGSFRSTGKLDGWILESTETSTRGGTMNAAAATTFNLGDDAMDRQYRAILAFDTSSLPDDAVITKATLKIKRQGIAGTNPFGTHGGLKVDIRKPYFGSTVGLVVSDFQATASKLAVAAFNKTPAAGAWYSAILSSTGYPYINREGTTQFRLGFAKDDNDDLGADILLFYSGNAAAANKPVLVVEYNIP